VRPGQGIQCGIQDFYLLLMALASLFSILQFPAFRRRIYRANDLVALNVSAHYNQGDTLPELYEVGDYA
jgi:hypothetical protein